jgi:hypothetical protein
MAGLPKYSTAFVGPGASPIGGCDMIGHIAVVTDPSFSSWSSASFVGGLSSSYATGFWVIICDSTTAGVVGRTTGNNTTNPINAPSGFELDYKPTFWIGKKTDADFCILVNKLPPTLDGNGYNTPTTTPAGGRPYFDGVSAGFTASGAKTWLNQNGYWTSYP